MTDRSRRSTMGWNAAITPTSDSSTCERVPLGLLTSGIQLHNRTGRPRNVSMGIEPVSGASEGARERIQPEIRMNPTLSRSLLGGGLLAAGLLAVTGAPAQAATTATFSPTSGVLTVLGD